MKALIRSLLIIFPIFCFAHPVCYFIPPAGWEYAHPKNLGSQIQIAFVGKAASDFRPSMNLATEEVDVPLKEYLKCVREIHESEMNVQWRDLGPFTFHSGKGRLAEITSPSPLGEIKLLQGIFIQDGCAYILTAAVLKDDFSSLQRDLLAAIRSLTVAPDLFSSIQDEPKKRALLAAFSAYEHLNTDEERQNQWSRLQKIVMEDYASLGPCWHFLVLKEGYTRIFPASAEHAPN